MGPRSDESSEILAFATSRSNEKEGRCRNKLKQRLGFPDVAF